LGYVKRIKKEKKTERPLKNKDLLEKKHAGMDKHSGTGMKRGDKK